MARASTFLALVLLSLVLAPAQAQELVFATAAEGRRILSTSDEYSKTMSAFDRSARLTTDREVSEAEYLRFAGNAALDWDPLERAAVEAALERVMPQVRQLRLPLPPRVFFVKTSGAEDAGAAYTRQNAIVLPPGRLALDRERLARLVAHELFHVATRAHPRLADQLYGVIGFRRCTVELPEPLSARRITNPDAPRDEHCIQVMPEGSKVWALPVLLSTLTRADFARGAVFLQNVEVVLLLVDKAGGSETARPIVSAGIPRTIPARTAPGFFEQIGRNTGYILHPEEIVADNFSLLALGVRDAPSPHILAGIEKVIARYAATLRQR